MENAGVEKAGAITYGKPSEQKTLKKPGMQVPEQRPGVHTQTSLFTIIVKDTGYHPISGDKPI